MKEPNPAANMTAEVATSTTQETTNNPTAETPTETVSHPSTSSPGNTIHNSETTGTDEAADDSANTSNGDQTATSAQDDSSKPDAVVSVQAPQADALVLTATALSSITPAPSDPQHIIALKIAFITAINNSDFVKDVKKVEKGAAFFTLVDPETRVRAQLETNAYKTLRAKAAKVAEQPGGIYVAPTKAEIGMYIDDGLKVWRDKQK